MDQDQPQSEQSMEVSGFGCREVSAAPNTIIKEHSHEGLTIDIILRGRGTERVDGIDINCVPGIVVVKPAGVRHMDRPGDRGCYSLFVEVAPDLLHPEIRPLIESIERRSVFQSPAIVSAAMRATRELHARDPFAFVSLQGVLFEIIAEVSRAVHLKHGDAPRWLHESVDRIRSAPAHRWSLVDLAMEYGIHPTHYARAFRRYMRCGVGDFIRRLRIEQAERDLIHGDSRIAEIALACGFADQAHFCKWFKRIAGSSPSAFRTAHRGRRSLDPVADPFAELGPEL